MKQHYLRIFIIPYGHRSIIYNFRKLVEPTSGGFVLGGISSMVENPKNNLYCYLG